MPFRVLMDPATIVVVFKVWICITRLPDSIKNQYRSWKTSVNISWTLEFCNHKDFLFSEAISTTGGMFCIRVGNWLQWWVLKMGRSQGKEKATQGYWELPGASNPHESRWHDGGRAKSSSRTSLDRMQTEESQFFWADAKKKMQRIFVTEDSSLRSTEAPICHLDNLSWEVCYLPGALIQDIR